jgi:hypothetical protein
MIEATTGCSADLLVVQDDDFTRLMRRNASFSLNTAFSFNFTAAELDVSPGVHKFAVYAVDSDGNVGGPANLTATISHTPTPSFSPSPHATQTPAPPNVAIAVHLTPWSFDNSGVDVNVTVIRTAYSGYVALL